ncbi:MAG: hypothetical protein U1F50_07485 [Rubrivivax sp.]
MSAAEAGTSPASTSGRISRMKTGVAAWVGDALGGAIFSRCPGASSHAVPIQARAVRGAGVDDAGARAGDHRGGFARGGVGQVSRKAIAGGVEQARALGRVLAAFRVDARHSMPRRAARYSLMRRPVVPSWPST